MDGQTSSDDGDDEPRGFVKGRREISYLREPHSMLLFPPAVGTCRRRTKQKRGELGGLRSANDQADIVRNKNKRAQRKASFFAMPTEDMMTMKPFADVGIRRHSEDDKRHGCYGKSCKRVSEYVRRQLTDEKLDRQLPFSRSPNKLSVQWTAFEVEGERDCMHSLRDSYAWEDVPSLLAQHTIKEPIVQKSADGTLQTTYQLEPVLEQIFDVVNADKAHSKARRWPETDGKIYQLRPHSKRPVLFAVPPDEAPGGVAGKLLQPVRIGKCARCTKCR